MGHLDILFHMIVVGICRNGHFLLILSFFVSYYFFAQSLILQCDIFIPCLMTESLAGLHSLALDVLVGFLSSQLCQSALTILSIIH